MCGSICVCVFAVRMSVKGMILKKMHMHIAQTKKKKKEDREGEKHGLLNDPKVLKTWQHH